MGFLISCFFFAISLSKAIRKFRKHGLYRSNQPTKNENVKKRLFAILSVKNSFFSQKLAFLTKKRIEIWVF